MTDRDRHLSCPLDPFSSVRAEGTSLDRGVLAAGRGRVLMERRGRVLARPLAGGRHATRARPRRFTLRRRHPRATSGWLGASRGVTNRTAPDRPRRATFWLAVTVRGRRARSEWTSTGSASGSALEDSSGCRYTL
jgi:hypothetical protein